MNTTKTKKAVVKKVQKPDQRESIADIFLTLPKNGLTEQEIANQVYKKTGGSQKNLVKMVKRYGNFSVYLGVVKKKEDKYIKI